MDPVRFDALTRALSQVRGRRGLVALLATLPLRGVLSGLATDETAAEHPHDRLHRRHQQRNRKRRHKHRKHKNNNNQNNNNGNNNPHNGGGGGGSQPGPGGCQRNGGACQQNNDCCGGNCFNQLCAAPSSQCGGGDCPAGATGCCTGTCCASPTNQCNALGECCAPNCAGKQCGPDGCGGSGTCGNCASGETCDATTGQCSPPATCTVQNCPDGCCSNGPGNPGTCETGDTVQQCGTGGAHCAHCPNTQTCQGKRCVACTQGNCFCAGQSACLNPEAPNVICSVNEFCYCAVTTAGVPVCASGAIQVRNGCQTDQDCVEAFAGAYCLNAANNVDPQNPCIFGQSFCAGACNP